MAAAAPMISETPLFEARQIDVVISEPSAIVMPQSSRTMLPVRGCSSGRVDSDRQLEPISDDEGLVDAMSMPTPRRGRSQSQAAPSRAPSLIWERIASDLQNGCYLLLEGKPCKCTRVTLTCGQVHVRATDIFSGQLLKHSYDLETRVQVPIVERRRYQCIALDEETGIASLRDEKGAVRRDLLMPVNTRQVNTTYEADDGCWMRGTLAGYGSMGQYLTALSRGCALHVIVQAATGQEEIVSVSCDDSKGVHGSSGAFFGIVSKLKAQARRIRNQRAERERRQVSAQTSLGSRVPSQGSTPLNMAMEASDVQFLSPFASEAPFVSEVPSLPTGNGPTITVELTGVRIIDRTNK